MLLETLDNDGAPERYAAASWKREDGTYVEGMVVVEHKVYSVPAGVRPGDTEQSELSMCLHAPHRAMIRCSIR